MKDTALTARAHGAGIGRVSEYPGGRDVAALVAEAQAERAHYRSAPDARREKLAAREHEQWCHWMHYLFSKCAEQSDGHMVIPAELVTRWMRQVGTPYAELSEREKESDRAEADKVLVILGLATERIE